MPVGQEELRRQLQASHGSPLGSSAQVTERRLTAHRRRAEQAPREHLTAMQWCAATRSLFGDSAAYACISSTCAYGNAYLCKIFFEGILRRQTGRLITTLQLAPRRLLCNTS